MTEALLYWALKKNHSQTRGAAALVDLLGSIGRLIPLGSKSGPPRFCASTLSRCNLDIVYTYIEYGHTENAEETKGQSLESLYLTAYNFKSKNAENSNEQKRRAARFTLRCRDNILRWHGSTARCSNQKRCKNWSMTTIQKPKSKHYSTLDH